MLNGKRAVPLKPTPPPFRNHGNHVVSVAELTRWLGEKAEEAGAYLLSRDRRREAAGRGRDGRRRPHGRQGPRQVRRREVATSSRAPTSWPGRPCSPRAAGATSPAPRSRASGSPATRPAGLGARRQGGVGGRAAAGPRHPHARLAAALRREVQGVRRLVDLPDEPRGRAGPRLDRLRRRARLRGRAALGPRRPAGVQAPQARAEDPRRRQARGLGREGDPRGRLLGDAAPARARHGHRRRRRGHGQRAQAQGDPLRDPLGHVRGGDDLPAAQGRLDATSPPTSRPCTTPRSARTSTSRAT